MRSLQRPRSAVSRSGCAGGAPARPQDDGSRDPQGGARPGAGKKPILLSPSPPPWEIPGEDGQRDTRCGPFECRRAPGQQEVAARPTRATRRCRACWRNPPLCRRASDLRVPEDRRAPQARAAIRRLPPVNAKRVYRLMKKHGLLLERHTGRRRAREHDGQVATIRSNCRWCSDTLEFACRGIRLLGNSPAGEFACWGIRLGTERLCVSRSPSTATTARRSPGLQRPPASPAR